MGPDAERSISGLSHLQEIHADLLQKIAALALLRKQIQRTEAGSSRKDRLSKTMEEDAAAPGRSILPTLKLGRLVELSQPYSRWRWAPEEPQGFMTILVY